MPFKLVCFDLDGTILDFPDYSWPIIHKHLDIDMAQVRRDKKDFFTGKISYHQWAQKNISYWIEKKATRGFILKALDNITPHKGAFEVLEELKTRGYRLAVLSGSVDVVLDKLGKYREYFDHILINRLRFDEHNFICGVDPTDYDMEKKADGLKHLAKLENIPLCETVFVGDNTNDVAAAKEAGLSIAVNCKSQELEVASDIVMEDDDLRSVLPYIFKEKEEKN